MNGTSAPLRIAVLINGHESTYKQLTRKSFETAITTVSESSTPPIVDFYDPIVAQAYPDASNYDLIVLSGGTADPMGSDPWVLNLQNYLRITVSQYPAKKIVGICWGHQTICVTFGGQVGGRETAELGIHEFTLTSEGREIFPTLKDGKMRIHEFHRRDITVPAEGFIPLAEGNQSFRNMENTIWTFQGHPELNPKLAKAMLDAAPGYMGVEGERKKELYSRLGDEHDGIDIWKRILQWVKESK